MAVPTSARRAVQQSPRRAAQRSLRQRDAQPQEPRTPSRKKSLAAIALKIVLVSAVVVAVLISLLTNVFSVVRYHGTGMEPALENGQTLVLLKTDEVSQGDIIAFYYNNKVLVRRIICEGGSSIFLGDTGGILVDGVALSEPYVETPSLGQCDLSFPYNVPVGHYFVMGDNRAAAMDSRLSEIGCVSQDRVLGKVVWEF